MLTTFARKLFGPSKQELDAKAETAKVRGWLREAEQKVSERDRTIAQEQAKYSKLEAKHKELYKKYQRSLETSPGVAKIAAKINNKRINTWDRLKEVATIKDVKSVAASALAQVRK